MSRPDAPLPIDAVLPDLKRVLDAHARCVLIAPPGAGKTTRVPLALLDTQWRGEGKIIVLEPRRLAARAAARRMAQTLGESVGETVGYRVRFETKTSARTRIEVVTEGIFTRMILDDPELAGIAAVLFDEFHERSLDGDLGLALSLDATALRPELRLVVMSATLDGARVAAMLGDAPVIESEGRAYPVDTIHVEAVAIDRVAESVISVIQRALGEQSGSVLVFLPGQAEIRRVAERLAERTGPEIDIAPLYGQLTSAEQDRAIQPAQAGRRKVVLATSIAQTSLTIEGVRIVIDSGLARVPVYEPGTGLTRLETRRVSRAAADQRRGRAGRTGPGVCYRMWHEGQTASLVAFDQPEILQADLSGLALDLAGWGVSDPAQLPFPDQPPAAAWSEAVVLLKSLDALDDAGRITRHGELLARLPLHPRLGHMIARAAADNETMDAALVAVVLSEQGLGGRNVDIGLRLDHLLRDGSKRAREARGLAAHWAKLAGGDAEPSSEVNAGLHAARAYPDRVAQSAGARGRFRLANGRGARVDETTALADAEYLVVTDIAGSAASGRIQGAAALRREDIENLFSDRIASETTLAFDGATHAVRARRLIRLGALELGNSATEVTDLKGAAAMLAAGIATLGAGALPWTKEQLSLRSRATFLHTHIGAPWPDLSDLALQRGDAAWLVPHITGITRLDAMTAEHLSAALFDLLPWTRRSEMDRLLPSHFDAPSGSRVPIDYAAENGPLLAIRVQELFGLDSHPSVADGRVPLLLSLLSPAQRPIQTTRDLPGFWRGSWRDAARDLKGRYPRHPWPDDPLKAQATRRAKPRG